MRTPHLLAASLLTINPALAQSQASVTIVHDKWGVPHISSDSNRGAYYGLGYACAKDRIFQMAFQRARIKGQLAKYLGAGNQLEYVGSDEAMVEIGFYDHMIPERIWPAQTQVMKNLLTAYADGVNAYVAAHESQLSQETNVPAVLLDLPRDGWVGQDCIAMWLEFAIRVGGQYGNEEEISNREAYDCYIEGGYTEAQALLQIAECDEIYDELGASTPFQQQLKDDAETYLEGQGYTFPVTMGISAPRLSSFSQGWAVGRNILDPNQPVKAVLFGHPQIPLSKPGLFWEAHVKGRGFEVRGACVPGTPNFMVGATDKVAWTATRLVMDSDDLYRLDTMGGTTYTLDGQPVAVRVVPKTIEVLNGTPVTTEYRESYWGPILDFDPIPLTQPQCGALLPNCQTTTGWEYALRLPGFYRPGAEPCSAYYQMYQSANADEFHENMGSLNWPPFNCVFADADGNVGYTVAGAMPVRVPTAPHLGAVAQDGDLTANDWKDLMPQAVKPHWINQDYAFSANNLPVSGSWYPLPLHPNGGHTDRSRRVLEMLDDLKDRSISGVLPVQPEDVVNMYVDDVCTPARDVTKMARYILSTPQPSFTGFSSNAMNAFSELDVWESKGAHLGKHLKPKDDGRSLAIKAHVFGQFKTKSSLTGLYGKREAGSVYWMRCRADAIDSTCKPQTCPPLVECQPPPGQVVQFTADEIDVVDACLEDAWTQLECALIAVGPCQTSYPPVYPPQCDPLVPPEPDPCGKILCNTMVSSCWEEWFTETKLDVKVPKWKFYGTGFNPLSTPAHFYDNFVQVNYTESILSQGSQHYSQAALLGPLPETQDLGQSLMPLGQSEVEGQPHYDDQVNKWKMIRLKSFPTVVLEAPEPPINLTYVYP